MAVYLPVEVSGGSPVWVIRQGGLPIVFGSGIQTQLGPIVLSPGENVTIKLTGANANATVDGQMIGWSALNPSELPSALPAPSSVSISSGTVTATITAGSVNVGTITGNVSVINAVNTKLATAPQQTQLAGSPFTAAAGATTTRTFTVDTNSHAVGVLLANFNGSTNISVTGVTSGVTYLNLNPIGSVFFAPILSSVDATVNVSVTMIGGQTSQVWVSSVDDPEVVTVVTNSGTFPVVNPAGGLLNTQQPQTSLGTLSVPLTGVLTSTGALTLPPGTHAIMISCPFGPNLDRLQVWGNVTNTVYMSTSPQAYGPGANQVFTCIVSQIVDPTILVKASGNFTQTIYITAILDTSAIVAIPSSGFPALPWQAPKKRAYLEGTASTAGATFVAGSPNLTIYVFGWEILSDGGATALISMWDSNFTGLTGRFAGHWSQATAGSSQQTTGYHAGMPLSVGAGINYDVSANVGWRILVSYNQE